jgi:hypothetical protein
MSETDKGQDPSEEELFYKTWGWETLKENIKILNDVLKIFLTTDIAVLSAFLGFYDKILIATCAKKIMFILLIISLSASIIGIYPIPIKVNLIKPEKVRAYKLGRVKFKSFCLAGSALSLILIFIIALIAMPCR